MTRAQADAAAKAVVLPSPGVRTAVRDQSSVDSVRRHPAYVMPRGGAVTSHVPAGGTARGAFTGSAAASVLSVGPAWDASGRPVAATVNAALLDAGATAAAGGRLVSGPVGVRLSAAPGVRWVRISIDASGFADGYGAGYLSRLRLVVVPPCAAAASRPTSQPCRATPVAGSLDAGSRRLGALVDLATGLVSAPGNGAVLPASVAGTAAPVTAPSASVTGALRTSSLSPAAATFSTVTLAASTSPAGETGDYRATTLSPTGQWSVGLNSGDFSYSYPLPQVPTIGGATPGLSLGYSSQSVDGRTTAKNSQPSWAGSGWNFSSGFVERRFTPCSQEPDAASKGIQGWGDLCWGKMTYALQLNGATHDLIPVPGTNEFRLRDDPGWKVTKVVSGSATSNGDGGSAGDVGESFDLTTPDGTRYSFGAGSSSWGSGALTDSVQTVPVFGDDTGEPCHQSTVSASWCLQAYKWNLDRVVDVHDNLRVYRYTKEYNYYDRNGDASKRTEYVRNALLHEVQYGGRVGDEPTADLLVQSQLRCTQYAEELSDACPSPDSTNRASYPDVPVDLICTSTSDCPADGHAAPTFFSAYRLVYIKSEQRASSTAPWEAVDLTELYHQFPDPDATGHEHPELWLKRVTRYLHWGRADQVALTTSFTGTPLPGIVAGNTGYRMLKYRVNSITNELGGQTLVTYGHADGFVCSANPAAASGVNQECFAQYWTDSSGASQLSYFHKYVVVRTVVTDPGTGGVVGATPTAYHLSAEPQVTDYEYTGGAGWAFDDDPLTPLSRELWGQWRGYPRVVVHHRRVQDGQIATSPADVSSTEYRYLRGLDGDHLDHGQLRSETLDTYETTPRPDLFVLRGQLAETTVRDDHGNVVHRTWNDFWTNQTVDAPAPVHTGGSADDTFWQGRDAQMVRVKDVRVHDFDPANQSSVRTTETLTGFFGDATAPRDIRTGLPTQVLHEGVLGDTNHRAQYCTTNRYRRNSAAWIVVPLTTSDWSLDCTTTELTRKRFYYDQNLGFTTGEDANLKDGDLTRTDSFASLSATAPTIVTTTSGYDVYGRATSQTDGRGNTTNTGYAPGSGGPVDYVVVTEPPAVSGAARMTMRTDYDRQRGLVTARTDENGQKTTFGYDGAGRTAWVVAPAQQGTTTKTASFSYTLNTDSPSVVKSVTLANDSDTTTAWSFVDGQGRAIQTMVQSPAPLTSSTEVLLTNTRYDELGRVRLTSAPNRTILTAGHPLGAWMPTNEDLYVDATETRHDALDRLVATFKHHYDGSTNSVVWQSKTDYSTPGQYTVVKQPPGGTTVYTETNYQLDADGNPTSITQRNPDLSSYANVQLEYSPLGWLTKVNGAKRHPVTYAYDTLGRRISSTDPDTGSSSSVYDGAGNVVTSVDAKGTKVSTSYDGLNRPTVRYTGDVTATPTTKLQTWAYDTLTNGKGKVTSQTSYPSPGSATAYTLAVNGYDGAGRPTGSTWSVPAALGVPSALNYSETYGYDAAGHPKTLGLPSVGGLPAETVTAAWSSYGQPSTLSSSSGGSIVAATGYDVLDRLSSRTWGSASGWKRSYGYDWASRVASVTTTDPGGAIKQADSYGYSDDIGRPNLTQVRDTLLGQSECYTYDQVDRLARAWTTDASTCNRATPNPNHASSPAGAPAYDQAWTYDQDTTITKVDDLVSGASTALAAPTAAGQPAHAAGTLTTTGPSASTVTQVFDANGALIQRHTGGSTDSYGYDEQHQLVTSTTAGVTTSFAYGPDASRWVRRTPTETTVSVGGTEVVYPAGGGAATGRRYYTLGGARVAVRTATASGVAIAYLAADDQGSTDISIDPTSGPNGTLSRTRYTPYGGVRTRTGVFGTGLSSTDKGFLGKTFDTTTGLNHLDARYYGADLGQFTTPDPLFKPSDPGSVNPYTYAGGNPVAYSDPSGLQPAPDSGVPCPTVVTCGPASPAASGGDPEAGGGGTQSASTRGCQSYCDTEDRVWGKSKPTDEDYNTRKQLLQVKLGLNWWLHAEHATQLLGHFLDDSGEDYLIDGNQLLSDLPSFRSQVRGTIARLEAQGKRASGWQGSLASPDESLDWYYAIYHFQYRVENLEGSYYQVDIRKRYDWGVPSEKRADLDYHLPLGIVDIHLRQPQIAHLNTSGLARDFNVVGIGYYWPGFEDYSDPGVVPGL